MRRINVLHIIEQLPLTGGAENLLWVLARNIDRSKFNLIFCCLKGKGYIAHRLNEEGFKILYLGNYRLRHFYKKIIDIIRLIKTKKVDIIHTHLILANKWGRMLAILSPHTKICKTEHATYLEFWKNGKLKNRTSYLILDKLLDRFTNRIIYVSRAQREIVNNGKYNSLKHVMIYNAFNEERFSIKKTKASIRDFYGYSNNDIVIGTVGRLVFSKGHEDIFTAVNGIKKDYPEIKIMVIGHGTEKSKLMHLSDKFGLDTLFLSDRYDVPELMKAMDIYVQPSFHEAFGITIAEAMFSGLPVIASNVGGIPEVVKDGETGILVPPQDPKALSEAIITLIQNPEMARTMGEKGREVAASKFSGERYARDMENLYASLINEKVKNNARH